MDFVFNISILLQSLCKNYHLLTNFLKIGEKISSPDNDNRGNDDKNSINGNDNINIKMNK